MNLYLNFLGEQADVPLSEKQSANARSFYPQFVYSYDNDTKEQIEIPIGDIEELTDAYDAYDSAYMVGDLDEADEITKGIVSFATDLWLCMLDSDTKEESELKKNIKLIELADMFHKPINYQREPNIIYTKFQRCGHTWQSSYNLAPYTEEEYDENDRYERYYMEYFGKKFNPTGIEITAEEAIEKIKRNSLLKILTNNGQIAIRNEKNIKTKANTYCPNCLDGTRIRVLTNKSFNGMIYKRGLCAFRNTDIAVETLLEMCNEIVSHPEYEQCCALYNQPIGPIGIDIKGTITVASNRDMYTYPKNDGTGKRLIRYKSFLIYDKKELKTDEDHNEFLMTNGRIINLWVTKEALEQHLITEAKMDILANELGCTWYTL